KDSSITSQAMKHKKRASLLVIILLTVGQERRGRVRFARQLERLERSGAPDESSPPGLLIRSKLPDHDYYLAFLFLAAGAGFGGTSHLLSTFFTQGTRLTTFVATPFNPPVLTLPVRVTTPAAVDELIVASLSEAVFASLSFTAALI